MMNDVKKSSIKLNDVRFWSSPELYTETKSVAVKEEIPKIETNVEVDCNWGWWEVDRRETIEYLE